MTRSKTDTAAASTSRRKKALPASAPKRGRKKKNESRRSNIPDMGRRVPLGTTDSRLSGLAARDSLASAATFAEALPAKAPQLGSAFRLRKVETVKQPKTAASIASFRADKDPKIGLGDPNKIGRGINRMNDIKNLEPSPQQGPDRNSRALNNLMKMMQPEACMSPDAQRYTALLDAPWSAPWGDEGEIQVKPVLYQDTVPPSTTMVCRQFGQMQVQSPANGSLWVIGCGGAGNQQDLEVIDSDTTRYAAPMMLPDSGVALTISTTFGAPNDGRFINNVTTMGAAGGRGSFGYWYQCGPASVTTPPVVDAPGIWTIQATAGTPFSIQNILQWGSPAPFGNMLGNDSSSYKFRPVASGMIITPVDAELSVGGQYNASVIPQATNESYANLANVLYGHGNSTSVADFYALPDHKIERADGSIRLAWLPSRQDYDFLQTTIIPANVGAGPVYAFPSTDLVTTEAANARMMVQIIPPADGNIHRYVVSYVSFFEVAGRCIQQEGTVPRPQPSLGAKIATSVQNSLNKEINDRTNQISKGAAFEVMKDHPKIGPMIEHAEDSGDVKSTFAEILDFGKELLPLAGLLL